MYGQVPKVACRAFNCEISRNTNSSFPENQFLHTFQTGRPPLFLNDAPPDIFLFQLPNPLLQELPLWFQLGQRQGFLIRGPSLSCPAEPAVHICTIALRDIARARLETHKILPVDAEYQRL